MFSTRNTLLSLAGVLLVAISPIPGWPQDRGAAVSFSEPQWEFRDSVRVVRFGGRQTLQLQTGIAYRRDLLLENGTIDVDVMTTHRRSFVYLNFRMQSDSAYEELYLRPHKSALPDAMQYAPVYQQQSAWQLYHSGSGTASPEIPADVWNHLRIVLQGRQAAIFLGDTTKPVLVVSRLGHEPRKGYLALRAFLPPGTRGSGPIARYANLRVRPDYIPFAFAAARDTTAAPGVVPSWLVGDAFVAPDSALWSIPSGAAAQLRRVDALSTGLVELHRLIPLRAGMRNVGTVARLVLIADSAGTYRMDLGFSDRITALLNGRPIFHRDDSYSFEARRDGLIGFDQATLFLPLQAGSNELSLIVSDRFGGWGLMGRFPSMAGIHIASP